MRVALIALSFVLFSAGIHSSAIASESDTTYTKSNDSTESLHIQQWAFYGEFGGNSIVVSVNLDWLYKPNVAFRAGVGFYVKSASDESDPNKTAANPLIIATASYLFFPSPLRIETGLGAAIDLSSRYSGGILPNNNTRIKPSLVMGLRFQPLLEKYILRVGYTPFFDTHDFVHWFGFSFGYLLN